MKYCTNCRGLGEGARDTAVNCGNHVMVDPDEERAKREAYRAKCAPFVVQLQALGFEVGPHEVELLDNGFRFSHSEPLTWRQLDRLSKEFGTKRINFIPDGGYHDTAGYHPEGYVDVLEPTR